MANVNEKNLNEETIYGVFRNTEEKPLEVGKKADMLERKKQLEATSSADGSGNPNVFVVKRIGETSWESLSNESLTEADEDEDDLSDDELDALDAEEEKAFKQKQAERRARIADKRKDKSNKEEKLKDILAKIGDDWTPTALMEIIVPTSGKADTVAGELIRACTNADEDYPFYMGEGLDDNGPYIAFVHSYFSDVEDEEAENIVSLIEDCASDVLEGEDYNKFLMKLCYAVADYIKNHTELLVEVNEKDSANEFDARDYFEGMIPEFKIEDCELPKELQEYLELEVIDSQDIVWYVQDVIMSLGNSTQDVWVEYDEYVNIDGLSKEDYDELGGESAHELYDYLEVYARDVEDEYGTPDEIRDAKEADKNSEDEEETDESLKETVEMFIYQFPSSMTEEDIAKAKEYGLDYLGKVNAEGHQPGDFAIKGTKENLEKFCKEYLDYEMHPDYLYKAEDFNTDILESLTEARDRATIEQEIEKVKEEQFDKLGEVAEKWAKKEISDAEFNKKTDAISTESKEKLKKLYTELRAIDELENQFVESVNESADEDALKILKGVLTDDEYEAIKDNKDYMDGYMSGKYKPKDLKMAAKIILSECEKSVDNKSSESYNDKELKEEASMDLYAKLEPLYNEGNVWFDVFEPEDSDGRGNFIVFDDWKSLIAVEKALKPDFEPKDEYDDSVLSEFDIDYGFSDEYARCSDCGKLIRTEPDSYSWVQDFFWDDNGIYCGDCVRENPEAYLNTLYNNPNRANTILSAEDLEAQGFERLDGDYESGWYDRNDNPEEILNKALEEHPSATFIFSITGQGQFATQFELWGADLDVDESLKK